MKRFLLAAFLFLFAVQGAWALPQATAPIGVRQSGVITPGNCAQWVGNNAVQDAGASCGVNGVFGYYVDSVNGNDANAGTSAAAPFADFAYFRANAVPNSTSIGIARNSLIRDILLIGQPGSQRNNITVAAYGTGADPVVDAGDVIPPQCWVLITSNTYSCTIAGPGTTLSTPYGTATLEGPFIGLYECKTATPATCTPAGAGGNDVTVQNVTALATTEATPGSYDIADMTLASITIHYQATDSSNPASNGYQVTYTRRANAIGITGSNPTVSGIIMRRNASEGGTCGFGAVDGGGGSFTNIECDQGSKHNGTWQSGATVLGGKFYDAYCPANVCGGSGNMFVAFDQTAQNKAISLTGVFFANSVGYTGSTITSGLSHTGSGTMGAVTITGGTAKSVGSGALGGFGFANVSSFTMNNYLCSQLLNCATVGSTATFNNVQDISTVTNNTPFTASLAGLTQTFNNVKACVGNVNHAVFYDGGTLTFSNSISYIQSPSASSNSHIADGGNNNSSLTVNNSAFDSALGAATMLPYNMTGTGDTFSGNNNTYHSAFNIGWKLNNSQSSTLSAWQTVVSPQDAASTVSGNGLAACTPIH